MTEKHRKWHLHEWVADFQGGPYCPKCGKSMMELATRPREIGLRTMIEIAAKKMWLDEVPQEDAP